MFIYAIQIICFLLFGVLAYVAWRRHELWIYLLATIYAALFENIDILVVRGQIGSYFYDERLILHIIETPLFIILSWGIIFYSSYVLARGLTKNFWAQALSVPLLATIIDFTMDPIATKMGIWSWVGYNEGDGILGVPLANFMGWYLVIFAFMITVRAITHIEFLGRFGKYILIPPAAFAVFFALFSVFSSFATTTGISISNQFIYLQLFFTVFALVCVTSWLKLPGKLKIRRSHYWTLLISRLLFYAFSIYGMVIYGFWQNIIFLELIIFALVIELVANIKFKLNAKT